MKNCAVIIPALNESLTIGDVVRGAGEHGCDVFVVNDASSDDTREKALAAGAEVLDLPFVSGPWGGIQAGLLHAMKLGKYSSFLTMDGDGQHDPACIPQLMATLASSGDNVVIGSFPERGSRARHLAWRFFAAMTRLKFRDITSGLRLYDAGAAAVLLSKQATMYDYQDLGVLLLLRRHGLTFVEQPVKMQPRQSGCSRIFRSWPSVIVYMVKTCVCILADWVSGQADTGVDWRGYDTI